MRSGLARQTIRADWPGRELGGERAGRTDAVAFAGGQPVVVFDWKSNVEPSAVDWRTYAGQLLEYMEAIWSAAQDKTAKTYVIEIAL